MKKKTYKSLVILILIAILYFFYKKYSNLNKTSRNLVKRDNLTSIRIEINKNKIQNEISGENSQRYSYIKKYPFLLDCRNSSDQNRTLKGSIKETSGKFLNKPAPKHTHEQRISRAVLVYFPIEQTHGFEYEFKWLFKSWIHMQKHEPKKWRTDIVVFIENDKRLLSSNAKFLTDMGCSFSNKRKSKRDRPMCTLLQYVPIKKRKLKVLKNDLFKSDYRDFKAKYNYLLDNVDIFNNDEMNLLPFYTMVKDSLQHYGYVDSILMAFDGYEYLNSAGYDFLIRSDIDVFLTPLFSVWLPKHCNDFYVDHFKYSDAFNSRRLENVASYLKLNYSNITDFGTTWISTAHQLRLVGYLTLFGMVYLSNEEFSEAERQMKPIDKLLPYWHYSVVHLYGQNLAFNHLISSQRMYMIKLNDYIELSSYRNDSIYSRTHIHVSQDLPLFSKYSFTAGKYDNIKISRIDNKKIKNFALKMYLDVKRSKVKTFNSKLKNVAKKKT